MWVIKKRFCTDINDYNRDLKASFGAHHFAKTTVGTHHEPPLPSRCAISRPFPTLLACPLRHLTHDDWFCWLLLLCVEQKVSEPTITHKVRQWQWSFSVHLCLKHFALSLAILFDLHRRLTMALRFAAKQLTGRYVQQTKSSDMVDDRIFSHVVLSFQACRFISPH